MHPWSVRAHNSGFVSENAIHHDDVASRFGFTGGLVPGVEVYAYLCHPPAELWGLPWIATGTMQGRFTKPIYDGETVTVAAAQPTADTLEIELLNEAGELCATGRATLPSEPALAPSADGWPPVGSPPDPSERPAASPDTLVPGTAFGLPEHGYHAFRANSYLSEIRETLPVYRDERVAHPGWLLRDANYVLAQNVRLGPWMHVESEAQHFAAVADGERVETRGVVAKEWEHKGHRFVELDVALLSDGRVAQRIRHTAIYRPRQVTT